MTRDLAVLSCDCATESQAVLDNRLVKLTNFAIDPIRSGRVAVEDIKLLLPGATLITADACLRSQVNADETGELRITDGQGSAFPLRPGMTFIEIVSFQTTWNLDQLPVCYLTP